MDFNAKLVRICEPVTGNGKNGTWTRQQFVFETEGNYPKQICVTVWGDKAIQNPNIMQIGARLNVAFELESREYNGRWYTDVRAWRIQEASSGNPQQAAQSAQLSEGLPTYPQQGAPLPQGTAYGLAAAPAAGFDNSRSFPQPDNDDLPF